MDFLNVFHVFHTSTLFGISIDTVSPLKGAPDEKEREIMTIEMFLLMCKKFLYC